MFDFRLGRYSKGFEFAVAETAKNVASISFSLDYSLGTGTRRTYLRVFSTAPIHLDCIEPNNCRSVHSWKPPWI